MRLQAIVEFQRFQRRTPIANVIGTDSSALSCAAPVRRGPRIRWLPDLDSGEAPVESTGQGRVKRAPPISEKSSRPPER
jgi:hypothetical protein